MFWLKHIKLSALATVTMAFVYSVSFSQVRTTVADGFWGAPATWDCTCVPAAGEDVYIQNTVTLSGTTSITNVTITSGSTLIDNKKSLTITGSLLLNGTLDGFKDVTLSGIASTISGIGSKTSSGDLILSGGNKTILSGSNLAITSGGVIISTGLILTNNGEITVEGDIKGPGTWVNATNSVLNVGGNVMKLSAGPLTASASGNTVNYYSTMGQSVFDPTDGYANLTLSSLGTKTLTANAMILEDLTISGATLSLGGFNINIGGNYENSGTLTQTTEVVTFDGAGAQQITNLLGETFTNMTVAKSGGALVLNNDVTVSGTLTLSSGVVDATSGILTLGTSTAAPGTYSYTGGSIVGQFERWIGSVGTYDFPVGTSSDARMASINATSIAGAGGSLIAEFISSSPGNNGLPLQDAPDSVFNAFVDGYWSLTQANTLNISGYDLSLTGTNFTAFTITGGTRLLVRPNSSSNWIVEGTHVAAVGSTVSRTGMTTISAEFGFGDTTGCSAPSTSVISGTSSVCTDDVGVSYSVSSTSGSTYTWTITGGTQASGGTTSSITVDWGSTGTVGDVQVVEYNGCSYGAPENFAVSIHSLPVSSITGRTSVPENASGEAYSVSAQAGYTYTWSVTGGTIASGQGTSAITVNWGTSGTGQVCVTGNSSCGSSAQTCTDVVVYYVINSVATGNWSNTAVWDCSCVPSATDNVRVKNTHTVSLTANTTINSLIIDGGGTLSAAAKIMTVSADFEVNGTFTGSNDLRLTGIGSYVSGNGTMSNSGLLSLRTGNKEITTGSTFNKSVGNIEIRSGVSVVNNGQISVAGNITGQDATVFWTNGSNSSLLIGGTLLSTGNLSASATGNTISYNGTSPQTTKTTDYYNLAVSGTATTTLGANTNVLGAVSINSGSTLNSNNFNINVTGNWTNDGGTFTAGTNTVTFNGTSIQIIGGTKGSETFNNVVVNSSSSVYVGASTTVTVANLSSSGTLDNDGRVKSGNGFTITGTLSGTGIHELTGGNWSNSGTFTAETSRVIFSGTTAQTISGASEYYDIEVNNSSGVSVSSGTQGIRGTLTLTSGNFSTGSLLTLLSDASQTGRIGTITGGSISGNVTAQRYESSAQSWHYISAPTSSTLADWQGEFWTSGYTGATYPSYYGFVSVLTHDETTSGMYAGRYNDATSSGQSINPGDGYLVWIGGWPVGNSYAGTIDVTGTVFTGPLTKTITYTAIGDGYDGWNLIANPYPSDIDLSLLSTSNIDNFIYAYDPAVSDFVSKSISGGDVIAQHQAFFAKASSAAGGSVTFNETSKTTGSSEFYRTTNNYKDLPMTLQGKGYTHQAKIRFDDNSTINFDSRYDAYQPRSLNIYAPYLATLSNTNDTLDINSIPDSANELAIPILIRAGSGKSGNYTLTFDDLSVIENRQCVYLEDLKNSTTTELRDQNSFTLYLSDTVTMPSFVLHLGPKIKLETLLTCSNDNEGGYEMQLSSVGAGSGPWDIIWKNDNEATIGETPHVVVTNSGTYQVEVTNTDGSCKVAKENVNVVLPASISITTESNSTLCFGDNTGSVEVLSSGGEGTHQYLWNNGMSTSSVLALTSGNYTVSVSDINGCYKTQSVNILDADEIIVQETVVDILCYGASTGSIELSVSGGTGQLNYKWNTGDNTDNLNNLRVGSYNLTVTDENGCYKIQQYDIIENDPMAITNYKTNVNCFGEATGSAELLVIGGISPYTYEWNNNLNTSKAVELPAGNYTVTVTDNVGCLFVTGFEISEPSEIIVQNTENDAACYNTANGRATIEVIGGTSPYNYLWSNDQAVATITGAAAGIYSYSVTDNNGCVNKGSVLIDELDNIVPAFTLSADTVYLSEGGLVVITNNTSGADNYLWGFGNGEISTLFAPEITYTTVGNYTVVLQAGNGKCDETIGSTVVVLDKTPTGINNIDHKTINIKLTSNEVLISNPQQLSFDYTIVNELGQVVLKSKELGSSISKIDVTHLNKGVYIISVVTKNNEVNTFKFTH